MARHFGMRGRLWALWVMQTLSGVFCIVMAYVDYSLGATIAVMIIFSIFCQQVCGRASQKQTIHLPCRCGPVVSRVFVYITCLHCLQSCASRCVKLNSLRICPVNVALYLLAFAYTQLCQLESWFSHICTLLALCHTLRTSFLLVKDSLS